MKYPTDHAFRTALEARIKQGQSDSAGVSRLRKRIVFERLLARLVAQAPGEWVLKGGFALELRLGSVARSTKDADFEWRLAEEDAIELLLNAAALDLGDRFTFALERADEETDLPGVANTSVIDAAKLSEAITVIFGRRGEHAVPAALPEPPAEWARPWRRLARNVRATEDIGEGYRIAVGLFAPILDRTVIDSAWQPGVGWRK